MNKIQSYGLNSGYQINWGKFNLLPLQNYLYLLFVFLKNFQSLFKLIYLGF